MVDKKDIEESEKIREHLSNVLGCEQPTFIKKPTFYYDMYKLGFICSGNKAVEDLLNTQPPIRNKD